jgi:C4-dicarboxylate-specific signal transduction histidine kinase
MLEERLNQTEKLASFGQLVAGIAHEIKNPLAIINSSLDVLSNGNRPQEQQHLMPALEGTPVLRVPALTQGSSCLTLTGGR